MDKTPHTIGKRKAVFKKNITGGGMAREFAKRFYHSKQWKATRDAYMRTQHGLCERCKERGIIKNASIVHHKVHLAPDNINDPQISLSFDNLEAVCRDCHAEEHPEVYGWDAEREPMRVAFDENGNVVKPGIGGLDG